MKKRRLKTRHVHCARTQGRRTQYRERLPVRAPSTLVLPFPLPHASLQGTTVPSGSQPGAPDASCGEGVLGDPQAPAPH